MARAVIEAAEACNSPVIIGPAESLLKFHPYEWLMPMLIDQARRAKVPVAVHLDHGYSFDIIMQAMQWGCGSGMISGLSDGNSFKLDPQGTSTRAQAAKILISFIDYVGI